MIDEKRLIEKIKEMFRPLLTPDGTSWCDDVIQAHNETLVDVLETIKELPKVNEWIPVEESLPKENGYYLITAPSCMDKKMTTMELYFNDGEWLIDMDDATFMYKEFVTAWMPLPKPYEKEVIK